MQLAVDKLPPNDARFSEHSAEALGHLGCVSLRWACVYTHPQAERWAQATLTRRGYETWLPIVTIRRRDRVLPSLWHDIEAPAFPRYLFVRHAPGSPTYPIAFGDGLAGLIRMGEDVAYASDMAIAALQSALQADKGRRGHQDSGFRPGTAVRLSQGPLRGVDAITLSSDESHTAISLVMLGALRTVTVPTADLVARD